MLSQSIADTILTMITIEKRYKAGDKLPNENELAAELNVSRTTLREAIRILVAYNILEIQRGKGTFVTPAAFETSPGLRELSDIKVNARDLYEMRLIFEPEAAGLAAVRGTDAEIKRILELGEKIEQEIRAGQDRTDNEHAFHKAIAKGVTLSAVSPKAASDTVTDHRMIMDFLGQRNAEGAKNAMKIHIMHAIRELGIE